MSHSFTKFFLDIIKLITEQDFSIREAAKLYHIPPSTIVDWLKAFHLRGLDGVKSPYKSPNLVKIPKPKNKKIEVPE